MAHRQACRAKNCRQSLVCLFVATVLMLFAILTPWRALAEGAFYAEEMKDGRIYVFYYMESYGQWKNGGEMGKSITRIGYGPNGETVVFDSNEAVNLYNYKHNLPMETFAPAPPPPPVQEKLPYKFSGYMFGDYYYNSVRDPDIASLSNVASQPGPEGMNGFQFRRIYFTFDDTISDKFSARFRLEANGQDLDSTGKISVFVKDAYLKWTNILSGSDFYFGIIPTPAYEVSENAWAYRSLERTIMDLRGIVPSRDFGVSLKGKLDSGGKFCYWTMFGNGSGNNPETDKFKRLYFHLQWRPTEKFQATLYQDYRALPDIPDPNNAAATVSNNSYTAAWFVNYGAAEKYGLGYEGFATKQQNGNTSGAAPAYTLSDKTTIGNSFWAWYNFTPVVGVVGRFDQFDPNTDASGDERNLFIGSLVVKPFKSVFIMPNLYWESYQDINGQPIKSSLTPRITLYYIFL